MYSYGKIAISMQLSKFLYWKVEALCNFVVLDLREKNKQTNSLMASYLINMFKSS